MPEILSPPPELQFRLVILFADPAVTSVTIYWDTPLGSWLTDLGGTRKCLTDERYTSMGRQLTEYWRLVTGVVKEVIDPAWDPIFLRLGRLGEIQFDQEPAFEGLAWRSNDPEPNDQEND